MKKMILFVPLVLVLLINQFDKDDSYFWIKIALLLLTIIYGIYLYIDAKKTKNNNDV